MLFIWFAIALNQAGILPISESLIVQDAGANFLHMEVVGRRPDARKRHARHERY